MAFLKKRIRGAACKYQFELTIDSLQMSIPMSLPMQVRWVRGPRVVKTPDAEGKNGHFTWEGDGPLVMLSTLYKEKKQGGFQKKKSKLNVYQLLNGSYKIVGFAEIDLAAYVSAQPTSYAVELPLHKCSDKKAMLSVRLHTFWVQELDDDDETASMMSGMSSVCSSIGGDGDIDRGDGGGIGDAMRGDLSSLIKDYSGDHDAITPTSAGKLSSTSSRGDRSARRDDIDSAFDAVSSVPVDSTPPPKATKATADRDSRATAQLRQVLELNEKLMKKNEKLKKQLNAAEEKLQQRESQGDTGGSGSGGDDHDGKLAEVQAQLEHSQSLVQELKRELRSKSIGGIDDGGEKAKAKAKSNDGNDGGDGDGNDDGGDDDDAGNKVSYQKYAALDKENGALKAKLSKYRMELEQVSASRAELHTILGEKQSKLSRKQSKLTEALKLLRDLDEQLEKEKGLNEQLKQRIVVLEAASKVKEVQEDKSNQYATTIKKLRKENKKLRNRRLQWEAVAEGDPSTEHVRRIKFYEDQLKESDDTLIAAKQAFEESSKVQQDHVQQLEHNLEDVRAQLQAVMPDADSEEGNYAAQIVILKKNQAKKNRDNQKLKELVNKFELQLVACKVDLAHSVDEKHENEFLVNQLKDRCRWYADRYDLDDELVNGTTGSSSSSSSSSSGGGGGNNDDEKSDDSADECAAANSSFEVIGSRVSTMYANTVGFFKTKLNVGGPMTGDDIDPDHLDQPHCDDGSDDDDDDDNGMNMSIVRSMADDGTLDGDSAGEQQHGDDNENDDDDEDEVAVASVSLVKASADKVKVKAKGKKGKSKRSGKSGKTGKSSKSSR